MEFLQQEVEREEQRALVKTGLDKTNATKKKETSIPTVRQ